MTAAAPVPALERAAYQKAARTVLMHPLITEQYPNAESLPLVRRWAGQLAEDLDRLFGYRLELTPTTARLVRVRDRLVEDQPATIGSPERPFDRRRYAYLALAIAVLGRSGNQIALSELAERVAGETSRIDGLELVGESSAHRSAFVDAVGWLAVRGALVLADGSARRWADDPSGGEALYDIDREVLRAIYRPTRILQHLGSVTDLLVRDEAVSRDPQRRESARRVRRALVEEPVVYYDRLDPADRPALRLPSSAQDVAELTGAMVERRAEGVALIDSSGRFTDLRFPAGGTVAQVALLLINRMADRIEDIDQPDLPRRRTPEPSDALLAEGLDRTRPVGAPLAQSEEPAEDSSAEQPETAEPAEYPLIGDGWLTATTTELLDSYGRTFAAASRADPARLLAEALRMLERLSMTVTVPGGALVLPLAARYRNAVVSVTARTPGAGLFDL